MDVMWKGRHFIIRPFLKSEGIYSVVTLADGLRPIHAERPEFTDDTEAYDWAFAFIKEYTKDDPRQSNVSTPKEAPAVRERSVQPKSPKVDGVPRKPRRRV